MTPTTLSRLIALTRKVERSIKASRKELRASRKETGKVRRKVERTIGT